MRKVLAFDMDGTIADLYHVPNWEQRLNAEDVTPYLEATPLADMKRLAETLHQLISQGWEVQIISWFAKFGTPAYNAETRKAKQLWLHRHGFPYHKAHFVKYGTTKAKTLGKSVDYAILIDDNKKVREGWSLGTTIDPTGRDLVEMLNMIYLGGL